MKHIEKQGVPARIKIVRGNLVEAYGMEQIIESSETSITEDNWYNKSIDEDAIIVVIDEGEVAYLEYDEFGMIDIPRKDDVDNAFHQFFWGQDLVLILPNYLKACEYLRNYYGGEFEVKLRDLGEHLMSDEILKASAFRRDELLKQGLLFSEVVSAAFELQKYCEEDKSFLVRRITTEACKAIEEFRHQR